MKLLGKLFVGKAAADLAGREVKKAKKNAKKAVKRTVKTVILMVLSFCAGAGIMAWFVYLHRNEIATAVYGDLLKTKFRHRGCLKMLCRKRK